MTLVRKDKEKLLEKYSLDLKWAKNIVVLKQFAIPVNNINAIRIEIAQEWWKLSVVKKRLFLNVIKNAWMWWCELDELEWSAIILYSYEDEFSPLKVIAKYIKQWKKEDKKYLFDYLWWWYDGEWKDKTYVKSLAELPTKPELVWKLLYLMNYPLQSFAMALDQISKKKSWE